MSQDVEQLKKYYRSLLKKYHPDTSGSEDDSVVRELIEEYKKLSKSQNSAEKPQKSKKTAQNLEYIVVPKSIEDVNSFILRCIKCIADNRIFSISRRELAIYAEFTQKQENSDEISAVLTCIGYLAENFAECDKIYDTTFEQIKKEFADYAENISKSSNYLQLLQTVNEPKSGLIETIIRQIPRICDENLKKMSQIILVFVICLRM